jgi:hypothetical protein
MGNKRVGGDILAVLLLYVQKSNCLLHITNGICRRRWQCGLRRTSAAARLLGSRVRSRLREQMFVSCVRCMLCRYRPLRWADTCLEQSYGCASLCDLQISTMRRPTFDLGYCATKKNWGGGDTTAFHSSLSYSFHSHFCSCKQFLVYLSYISVFVPHTSETFQFRNGLFLNLASISHPHVSDTLL